MKDSILVLMALSVLGGSGNLALASPIEWIVPTVAVTSMYPVQQSATVSGRFIYDLDSNSYPWWNFNIAGFAGTEFASLNGTLTPANSAVAWAVAAPIVLRDQFGQEIPTWQQFVGFQFSTDRMLNFSFFSLSTPNGCLIDPPCVGPGLTNTGGEAGFSVTVGGPMTLEVPVYSSFYSAFGTGVVSSTPEPVSCSLVLIGALAFAGWRYRGFSQRRS